MNYITPNFHFQHGGELFFSTHSSFPTSKSNSTTITHQHLVPDMLLAPTPCPLLGDDDPYLLQAKLPTKVPPSSVDHDNNIQGTTNKRKMTHRDVERQRRHEMALLYGSLRSHLPNEYLKGKRSLSDHIDQAANYIKHQQEKIRQLTEKRDALLRRFTPSSPSNSASSSAVSRILALPEVTVQSCCAGVEVVVSSRPDDEVSLSRLVGALVGEGLDVVSLISTAINDKSVCAIQCEACGVGQIDLGGLKEKLIEAMRSLD
ncbi:hypothetical protein ACLOJK_004318 [Asimina triloba]